MEIEKKIFVLFIDTFHSTNLHQNMEIDDDQRDSISINTQKKNWIVTYASPSGERITIQMLSELGSINADECHTTTDRIMSYTYIHLTKRIRQATLSRFMEKAKLKHGITQSEIFGYESIASTMHRDDAVPIEQHIAFKMLVDHANSGNPSFQPCTDGQPILIRGILFKATELQPATIDLARQTKTQLIQYIKKLEQVQTESRETKLELNALKQFYQASTEERSRLRVENAEQKR